MDSGFFDLQVNGYAGVDFNRDDLTPESLHHACESLQADGVAGILATIITEQIPLMCARLERLAGFREDDPLARLMIAGFHIEGPFISPEDGFRGAHPKDAVRVGAVDDAQRLVDSGRGLVRLFTLAPELDDGFRVTTLLTEQGIAVSAGHCNPTLDQLDAAIDSGVTLFTHVGNGCPMYMPRHENVIQRALSRSDRLTLCFIADGAHIPYYALGNYLKVAGIEHSIIVTDATAAAGMGPGTYRLGRWKVEVGEDLVARSPDGTHLVGSAMPMKQAAQNLRNHLGLMDPDVFRLGAVNPRSIMSGN